MSELGENTMGFAAVTKRARRIGELLDVSTKLMRQTFRQSATLIFIAALPTIAALVLLSFVDDPSTRTPVITVAIIVSSVLTYIAYPAMVLMANDAHEGIPLSLKRSSILGFKRSLWLLLAIIVMYIALQVVVGPLAGAYILTLSSFGFVAGSKGFVVVAVIGYIGMLAAWFFIGARFLPSIPIVMVERHNNPFTMIGRSWGLTRGRGWPLSGFLAFLYMMGWMVPFTFGALLSGIISNFAGKDASFETRGIGITISVAAGLVVFLGMWASSTVTAYHDLLVRQEGRDLFELANRVARPGTYAPYPVNPAMGYPTMGYPMHPGMGAPGAYAGYPSPGYPNAGYPGGAYPGPGYAPQPYDGSIPAAQPGYAPGYAPPVPQTAPGYGPATYRPPATYPPGQPAATFPAPAPVPAPAPAPISGAEAPGLRQPTSQATFEPPVTTPPTFAPISEGEVAVNVEPPNTPEDRA